MSDNVNTEMVVQNVLDRIKELNDARENVAKLENELNVHEKDLKAIETVKGANSDEYLVKKELIETTRKELNESENKVKELSFKRSELKPVFEEVAKKFEDELRAEQEREFHVEVGPNVYVKVGEGDEEHEEINPVYQKAGVKAFKHLLDYLYKDVKWTAKTAPGLLVLVRNMEENKEWVRSKDFDNVIKLRSSNVLVLWKSILEEMEGKGFYEAKTFLEVWANCGKGISQSVNEIRKYHESVRLLGTNLNTIEDEYLKSENDIEETEMTTQEEVAPEV